MKLSLRVEVEGEKRAYPLLGAELRIGRGVDNDIVLSDPSVSRRHAVVLREGERWLVRDAGSTNGLLHNRQRVREAALGAGDALQVGIFELAVEVAAEASELAAEPRVESTATLVRPLDAFAASWGLQPVVPGATVISKRVALDQAYENRIFGYLTRLAGLLLTAETEPQILERVSSIAFEALPVDRCFVLVLDESGRLDCALSRVGATLVHRPSAPPPISRTMVQKVLDERVALVTLDAQADARLQLGESLRLHQIRSAMCVPLWSGERIAGVMQVDSPHRAGIFSERDLDFATALANYAAVALDRAVYARRAEVVNRLRARLDRYHSPGVVEALLSREEADELARPAPAEATVFFADLVGFTSIAETRSPEEVADLLREFFDIAVEAVFRAGGTLDKFIGDCVMAFFGAPVPQADHARRAVTAAIDLQRRLARRAAENASSGRPALAAHVGIQSGPVVVGEVGSSRRVDYTVLGNTVNVASRLVGVAARPGDIVLGAETARQLGDGFELEPLGELALRGLSRPVRALRVGWR